MHQKTVLCQLPIQSVPGRAGLQKALIHVRFVVTRSQLLRYLFVCNSRLRFHAQTLQLSTSHAATHCGQKAFLSCTSFGLQVHEEDQNASQPLLCLHFALGSAHLFSIWYQSDAAQACASWVALNV